MPRKNRMLRIGDRAPDFEIIDPVRGEKVRLRDLRGKPLALIFGRGTW